MRDRTTTAVILPVAVESRMQFGVVHDGFDGTGDLTEAVHLFGALLIAGVGGAAAETPKEVSNSVGRRLKRASRWRDLRAAGMATSLSAPTWV